MLRRNLRSKLILDLFDLIFILDLGVPLFLLVRTQFTSVFTWARDGLSASFFSLFDALALVWLARTHLKVLLLFSLSARV